MPAYINPASVRVDVSDLMTWRDEAVRTAKEALPNHGNDIAKVNSCIAVAAVLGVICDGWKSEADLMDSFKCHMEIVSEEVFSWLT